MSGRYEMRWQENEEFAPILAKDLEPLLNLWDPKNSYYNRFRSVRRALREIRRGCPFSTTYPLTDGRRLNVRFVEKEKK